MHTFALTSRGFLILLLVLAASLHLHRLPLPGEGDLLAAAWDLHQGRLPYRDVAFGWPPLSLAVVTLPAPWPEGAYWLAKLVALGALVGTALAVRAIATTLNLSGGRLAALLYVLLSVSWPHLIHPEVLALPLCAWAACLYLRRVGGEESSPGRIGLLLALGLLAAPLPGLATTLAITGHSALAASRDPALAGRLLSVILPVTTAGLLPVLLLGAGPDLLAQALIGSTAGPSRMLAAFGGLLLACVISLCRANPDPRLDAALILQALLFLPAALATGAFRVLAGALVLLPLAVHLVRTSTWTQIPARDRALWILLLAGGLPLLYAAAVRPALDRWRSLAGRPLAEPAIVAAVRAHCPGPLLLAGPDMAWIYPAAGKRYPGRYPAPRPGHRAAQRAWAAQLRTAPPACAVTNFEQARRMLGYQAGNPFHPAFRTAYERIDHRAGFDLWRARPSTGAP